MRTMWLTAIFALSCVAYAGSPMDKGQSPDEFAQHKAEAAQASERADFFSSGPKLA